MTPTSPGPDDYVINNAPMFQALEAFDVQRLIDTITDPWHNQTLIQVDDVLVRLGVMHGEYHWHQHDEQDEFFLLLAGELHIELEGREPVVLQPLQAFSVPAGLRHRPVAPVRSAALMIERVGVVPTGD